MFYVCDNENNMLSGGDEDDSDEWSDVESQSDEDDHGCTSARAIRSTYVGRGNVQAVRAARRRAGLSDSFPRSDPLIMEFAAFMRASGAAAKDIDNKTQQVGKLLHYLSTRY